MVEEMNRLDVYVMVKSVFMSFHFQVSTEVFVAVHREIFLMISRMSNDDLKSNC